jgi:hypothetical protein
LDGASGNERVGAVCLRASGNQGELPHFVAAEREWHRVVSLDQEARSAAESGR